MKRRHIPLMVFALASASQMVAAEAGWMQLEHIAKPLIMVALAWYYVMHTARGQRSVAVVLAMLFSFLGDSLLMYATVRELYFMAGLGAFLLAHICYILAYRQHQDDPEEQAQALVGVHRVRMALPVILAGSGLVVVLYPALGDLKTPVLVYATVLVVMVLTALFRFGRTAMPSYWMVFGGAILFMMSDAMLAVNKFLEPLSHGNFWIMSTYVSAQYLIIRGLIRHHQYS